MENFLRSSYDIATTAEYTLWVTGPEVALEMLRVSHVAVVLNDTNHKVIIARLSQQVFYDFGTPRKYRTPFSRYLIHSCVMWGKHAAIVRCIQPSCSSIVCISVPSRFIATTMPKIAHEEFDAQRERVKEADALAQIFQISGDLVQSRLLITQVCDSVPCVSHIDWCDSICV